MVEKIIEPSPTIGDLPVPEQTFEWPREAEQREAWPEAAGRWTLLRKAYPKHPATWYQGAYACIEAGEMTQAKQLLEQATQLFPQNPNALFIPATLAMREQQWDSAEKLLANARDQHPDNVHSWLKSATCAELQGDIDRATTYLQQACESAPASPFPLIQYAELAMRNKQWEEALLRWEELRRRFPDHAAGYQRGAEAARQLGRQEDARQLIFAQLYGSDGLDTKPGDQHDAPATQGNTPGLPQIMELIWTKATFNLRSEVYRNYLGYMWWLLEPLLYMLVYYIVFGLLLQRDNVNYPAFLLTGLVPWMWFMKAVGTSSGSILAGQNLMLQVGLPSFIFPLISILQVTLKQIPVFLLLLGFIWLQGHTPGNHWWALLPVILVQALLTLTVACAVAAVIPFIRDLEFLVPTGLTFLMFLSGIFYDYRSISAQWQDLFLLNPIAFLLKCYREIFIDGVLPDVTTLTWWGLGSGIACLVLVWIYKQLRYTYPRIVIE